MTQVTYPLAELPNMLTPAAEPIILHRERTALPATVYCRGCGKEITVFLKFSLGRPQTCCGYAYRIEIEPYLVIETEVPHA